MPSSLIVTLLLPLLLLQVCYNFIRTGCDACSSITHIEIGTVVHSELQCKDDTTCLQMKALYAWGKASQTLLKSISY